MRRSVMVVLACVAVLVGPDSVAGSGDVRELSREERVAALRALDVRPGPASVELARSGSAIEVRPGQGFLVGEAARRFMSLTQGVAYPATEAVIIGGGRGFVVVERFDVGYVPVSDWAGFDSARLMAGIKLATGRANARRGADVGGGIEVVGWAEEPRLVGPAAGDGVRWAIRAVEGDGQVTVNAVVLRLGRRGYQKLTWVGAEAAYDVAARSPPRAPTAGGLLEEVADGHRFRPGHAHGDHAAGDAVAPFGLTALVAATAAGEAPPEHDDRAVSAAAAVFVPEAWPAAALLFLAGWALVWVGARAWPSLRARRILSAAGPGQNKGHERRCP